MRHTRQVTHTWKVNRTVKKSIGKNDMSGRAEICVAPISSARVGQGISSLKSNGLPAVALQLGNYAVLTDEMSRAEHHEYVLFTCKPRLN